MKPKIINEAEDHVQIPHVHIAHFSFLHIAHLASLHNSHFSTSRMVGFGSRMVGFGSGIEFRSH